MSCQLYTDDCLNEIFEYFEEDKITLLSCLLVNRLWCQVAVRILWNGSYRLQVPLSTLIACLPNESKDLLNKNEIFFSPPTSKPPLFNYPSFCKDLSIYEIYNMIKDILKNELLITSQTLHYETYLVSQELLKMFMKQITSLKSLNYNGMISEFPKFTYYSGAKNCLTDLSVFKCQSNICPEFFYQLSQICHNIQTFTIFCEDFIPDGLVNLISLQNNLKELDLHVEECSWEKIIPSLAKHYNTLTRLYLYNYRYEYERDLLPLSFALCTNLQYNNKNDFREFRELQNGIFPKLEILVIAYQCPEPEYVTKFLENNGKNLKELRIDKADESIKLSIAKFCPNLKT